MGDLVHVRVLESKEKRRLSLQLLRVIPEDEDEKDTYLKQLQATLRKGEVPPRSYTRVDDKIAQKSGDHTKLEGSGGGQAAAAAAHETLSAEAQTAAVRSTELSAEEEVEAMWGAADAWGEEEDEEAPGETADEPDFDDDYFDDKYEQDFY